MEAKLSQQFRLKDDVESIYNTLRETDRTMERLVKRYCGLRVMRVDMWECLVFFILAVRARIKKTHERMDQIARTFKTGLPLWNGRYSFSLLTDIPEYDKTVLPALVELSLDRDKDIKIYIASLFHMNHSFDLLCQESSLDEILKRLQDPLWGVGDKTANCVSLFSLERLDAFPVDTHIYAALERLYCEEDKFPKQSDPQNPYAPTVRKWAQQRFGRYAGYASQFLFADDYPETQRR